LELGFFGFWGLDLVLVFFGSLGMDLNPDPSQNPETQKKQAPNPIPVPNPKTKNFWVFKFFLFILRYFNGYIFSFF